MSYLGGLGGEIQTGARVERILTHSGRVSGVGVEAGQQITAPVVIAAVMPHALIAMTGEALPAWYRRALSLYVYGPATVKVDWALNGPIPWLAAEARDAAAAATGCVKPCSDRSCPPRPTARHSTGCSSPARPRFLAGQCTESPAMPPPGPPCATEATKDARRC